MKNFIYYIALILLVSHAEVLMGQQEPLYSQYMFNKLSLNPGFAGTEDGINLTLFRRSQWIGFDGAPKANSLSFHSPVGKYNLGAGGSIVQDNIGPLNLTTVLFDLASKIEIRPKHFISGGIKVGFDLRKTKMNELKPVDVRDNAYGKDDIKGFYPNIGAGIYYYSEGYYAGISIPKFNKSKIGDRKSNTTFKEQVERHYYLMGGYDYEINHEFILTPSILIKKVKAAPGSIDLGVSCTYDNYLIVGLSSRFGDSFGMHFQIKAIEMLWVGYAFDLTTTELNSYNSGTHEIMLHFNTAWWEKNEVPRKYRY